MQNSRSDRKLALLLLLLHLHVLEGTAYVVLGCGRDKDLLICEMKLFF